jgi:hypothetical protein
MNTFAFPWCLCDFVVATAARPPEKAHLNFLSDLTEISMSLSLEK